MYRHTDIDRAALFQVMADPDCPFLLTYEAAPDVIAGIRRHGFHAVRAAVQNARNRRPLELIITRDAIF